MSNDPPWPLKTIDDIPFRTAIQTVWYLRGPITKIGICLNLIIIFDVVNDYDRSGIFLNFITKRMSSGAAFLNHSTSHHRQH